MALVFRVKASSLASWKLALPHPPLRLRLFFATFHPLRLTFLVAARPLYITILHFLVFYDRLFLATFVTIFFLTRYKATLHSLTFHENEE